LQGIACYQRGGVRYRNEHSVGGKRGARIQPKRKKIDIMQETAPPQEKRMRPSDDCPHSLAAAPKVIVHLLANFIISIAWRFIARLAQAKSD